MKENAQRQIKINKAYSVYCGIVEYNEITHKEMLSAGFKEWIHAIPGNIDFLNKDDLNKYYYPPFVESMLPTLGSETQCDGGYDCYAEIKRFRKKIKKDYTLSQNNKEIKFRIEYLDVFTFPENLLVFCFRTTFPDPDADSVSSANYHLREYYEVEELKEIKEYLKPIIGTEPEIIGNKLKLFNYIEHEPTDKEMVDNMLYDIGTCSPIGSAQGLLPDFQPSEVYFDELIRHNSIEIFKTWKALCLFDSFTVALDKPPHHHEIWEYSYFSLIYVHSLYVKYFLYRLNNKFHKQKKYKIDALVKEFNQFDHIYNLNSISHNFLPQKLYDKLRFSLEIEEELQIMRSNLDIANQRAYKKRNIKLNRILSFIAFLTIITTILDGSVYINKVVFETNINYVLATSITSGVIIIFLIRYYKLYVKQ